MTFPALHYTGEKSIFILIIIESTSPSEYPSAISSYLLRFNLKSIAEMSDSSDVDMHSDEERTLSNAPRSGKKALLKRAQLQEESEPSSDDQFDDEIDESEAEDSEEEEEEIEEEKDIDDDMDENSDDQANQEVDWDGRVKQRVLLCASRGISHRCVSFLCCLSCSYPIRIMANDSF